MSEEEVIISIKSCINSSKGGVSLSRINHDYREMMGENIPFSKLGYNSLRSFIYSIEDIMVSKTAQGDEMLTCCGGKSAHIAKLVSMQKSAPKPARKKSGKVISLPRHFREQTKHGSTRDLRSYGTSDHRPQKYNKHGQENIFRPNLPPRLRAKAAADSMARESRSVSRNASRNASHNVSRNESVERDEKEFYNQATSYVNGSYSSNNEERQVPKVSKPNLSAGTKVHRKSRLLHSQKFMKRNVDNGFESGEAYSYNGVGNSMKVKTIVGGFSEPNSSGDADENSRLLRGPSACMSAKPDEDEASFYSFQPHDAVTTKTLTITVSNNRRNVMCIDNLPFQPLESSNPKKYISMSDDYNDHPLVVERNREKERLGVSTSGYKSYGVQDPNLVDSFDVQSRLVGRVVSQRRGNGLSGVDRLSSYRDLDHPSASDDIEALINNFSSLKVAEAAQLTIVEPTLFTYLLIGDDFFLDLAHNWLGANCVKVNDRVISCGLCYSGQNMPSCLYRVKHSKLLSKVMLLIGAVDILEGSPIENMKCHMVMLVNYVHPRVKKLIILTVPPLPLTDDRSSWHKLMNFNRWLVTFIGTEYANVHVVDTWHLFENPPGQICEEMFEEDSVPMYKSNEEVLLWNNEGRSQLVDHLRGVVQRFAPTH